jgi:3,4-dihydroxy-9,10-secoandrosta-1,3,5(10)-triene-9,17-dione 4,5-dioxygenase
MREMQLGYLRVHTHRMDDWTKLATEVIGLSVEEDESFRGNGHGKRLRLRADDHVARIVLDEADEEKVVGIGWELPTREAYDELVAHLEASGVELTRGTQTDAEDRYVTDVVMVKDPADLPTEFYYGPHVEPIRKWNSPLGVEFVTADQGLGHVTVWAHDFDETVKFYRDVLNFHVRESANTGLRLSFMGCNPRQHAIAIIGTDGPSYLDHLMLEVADINDVGRALDKCNDGAAPIALTLGRHWNDWMISFYLGTPSGFLVEYGFGGRRVDLSQWNERQQRGIGGSSFWGHRVVGSSKQLGASAQT